MFFVCFITLFLTFSASAHSHGRPPGQSHGRPISTFCRFWRLGRATAEVPVEVSAEPRQTFFDAREGHGRGHSMAQACSRATADHHAECHIWQARIATADPRLISGSLLKCLVYTPIHIYVPAIYIYRYTIPLLHYYALYYVLFYVL